MIEEEASLNLSEEDTVELDEGNDNNESIGILDEGLVDEGNENENFPKPC